MVLCASMTIKFESRRKMASFAVVLQNCQLIVSYSDICFEKNQCLTRTLKSACLSRNKVDIVV